MELLQVDMGIYRGFAAQSKCHIGISPSGQKMGHWDLSQSHVQYVSGIDPNVKKRGFWDQSQCHVQAVIGIDPIVMKNKTLGSVPKSYICGNLDNSQTSFILTLGQIPVLYILGFWDKSQNYQRNNSGIGGLTTVDCLVSVPILWII